MSPYGVSAGPPGRRRLGWGGDPGFRFAPPRAIFSCSLREEICGSLSLGTLDAELHEAGPLRLRSGHAFDSLRSGWLVEKGHRLLTHGATFLFEKPRHGWGAQFMWKASPGRGLPGSPPVYLFNCFTKKLAMMWLASSPSGSSGLYQKACGSAS